MLKKKHFLSLVMVIGGLLLATACSQSTDPPDPPDPIPTDSVAFFRTVFSDPAECASCHPNHYNEWQTSMHAYGMADPIMQALNKIGQERSNGTLDQFCIKCHSPFSPLLQETPGGEFEFSNLSPIVKASISCDVCHSMNTEHIKRGEGISKFRLDRVRRATIPDPVANEFHESAFDIEYSTSDICSPCHDLKAPDLSFFIETTNIEWDESPYQAMGLECQDCHMPAYAGKAATTGPDREAVHRHSFIGVDYPLIDFPGKEETIAAVRNLLENSVSMTVNVRDTATPDDTLSINIRIKNDRTGHSVPSGAIFERQMWLEVILKDPFSEEIYYSSGLLDDNSDLRNYHSEYVASGQIPEDTALVLYNGKTFDASNEETLFFWEAKSVERNTIEAFKTAFADYQLRTPLQPGTYLLTVRLRFRSFPPYLFRAIGQEELLSELLIFDMETFSRNIIISN